MGTHSPVRVGDLVYELYDKKLIRERKIDRVIYASGIGYMFECDYDRYWRKYDYFFSEESIGISVFLSYDEAESKLREYTSGLHCHGCGMKIDETCGYQACPHCGRGFYCRRCGKKLEPGDFLSCSVCGKSLPGWMGKW